MAIPFKFHPAEQAKSSEVNRNFDHIMDIIGATSTRDRIVTSAELVLGYQGNMLLTGEADKDDAPTSRKFFQMGWNAEWTYVNGRWTFSRFIEGEPATVMRMGYYGFDFMVTSATGGNLNGQLEPVMAIRATTGDDYIYIKNSFHIQNVDDTATDLQDYRLTYVPMDPIPVIYDGVALTNQDTVRDMRNYGVSSNAKMVKISVEGKAGASDAYIRFLKQEASPHRKTGFTMHAQANKWNSQEGDVRLGEGSNVMEVRIVRVNSFTEVYAYVKGYWV